MLLAPPWSAVISGTTTSRSGAALRVTVTVTVFLRSSWTGRYV